MNNKFIPFGKPLIGEMEKKAVASVLRGTALTHGPVCREFEHEFGKYHKNHWAVTLSNCTSAMFLSLKAYDIGQGDEVIVPAMTHIATAHCVSHTGAKVVFCDVDKKTGNIDFNKLKMKISKRTKAVIIVHYVGLPAEMDEINKVVKNKNILLIEDCAAALGSKFDGNLVGTLSDIGCYSFYPTKHITTMEGGILITKNKKLADKIRKLSSFGYNKNLYERSIPGVYDVDLLGYNLRMTEVAAAIGIEQLKRLPEFLKIRKRNAEKIKKYLSYTNNVNLLPSSLGKSEGSNFCVNVLLKSGGAKKRNSLLIKLKENNIGTSVHYPVSLPNSKYYKKIIKLKKKSKNEFVVSSYLASHTISLPCGPHLKDSDCKIIANTFLKCFKEL